MFLLVATLATLVPPPPAPPPPRPPETRLEALRALADQATHAFRSGGLDLVKVNVVEALARELTRR